MGQYREKTCEHCGVKHRKRGPFCSKVCSNKGRSPEVYKKVSEALIGGEAIYNLNADPDKEPPLVGGLSRPLIDSNSFVSDGDIWTSADW